MVTCAASDVYVYLVKKDKRQMFTSERNGNKSSVQLTLNLFTITWITASVNKIHQKSFEPFEVLGKFSPVRFSWNERKNSEVTYILGGQIMFRLVHNLRNNSHWTDIRQTYRLVHNFRNNSHLTDIIVKGPSSGSGLPVTGIYWISWCICFHGLASIFSLSLSSYWAVCCFMFHPPLT